ncbi:MAG: hypothetical protein H6706_14395 [Myxococcales bacterium]|nr:hypothetical protein [Myxococcales bacterium]
MIEAVARPLGRLVVDWVPAGEVVVHTSSAPHDRPDKGVCFESVRMAGRAAVGRSEGAHVVGERRVHTCAQASGPAGRISVNGGPFEALPRVISPTPQPADVVVVLDGCPRPFSGRLRLGPSSTYSFSCAHGPSHHLRVSVDSSDTLVTVEGPGGRLYSTTLASPDELAYFGIGVGGDWTVTCEKSGHIRWAERVTVHPSAARGQVAVDCSLVRFEDAVVVSSAISGVRFKAADFDAPLRRLEADDFVNGPHHDALATSPGARYWLALPSHTPHTDVSIWARATGYHQRQYVVPRQRPPGQPFEIRAVLRSAVQTTPIVAADVEALLRAPVAPAGRAATPDGLRPWLWVVASLAVLTAGAGATILHLGQEEAIANQRAFRRGARTEAVARRRDADARSLQDQGVAALLIGGTAATALTSYLLTTGDHR